MVFGLRIARPVANPDQSVRRYSGSRATELDATSRDSVHLDRDESCASVASQSRAAFSAHCIKHRLDIRRRAGDDAQDFTRRSLLLQA